MRHDRQRYDMVRRKIPVYQETRPIFGYVIGKNISRRDWRAPVEREERRRGACRECTLPSHLYRGQHALGPDVENLFAIRAPARLAAAATRHLPFAGCVR